MGFFEWIINFIRRHDYDNKIRKVESRVDELRTAKRTIENKLQRLKNTAVETPNFIIKTSSRYPTIKSFTPPKRIEVRTMKDLMAKRNKIERLTASVTQRKDEADNILSYLRENRITRFYHFTDESNLPLIKKHGGLYSWSYCEKNDINIPNPGGSDYSRSLDSSKGLQDFVRLSFCDDHPMAWRKYQEGSSLVLLYVDVEVASFKETLFADRNAASSSFSCGDGLDDLKRVNLSATKRHYVGRSDGEIFFQHQAECMVKTFIPLKYIMNFDYPQRLFGHIRRYNDTY